MGTISTEQRAHRRELRRRGAIIQANHATTPEARAAAKRRCEAYGVYPDAAKLLVSARIGSLSAKPAVPAPAPSTSARRVRTEAPGIQPTPIEKKRIGRSRRPS